MIPVVAIMDPMYWFILFLLCIVLPISIIWAITSSIKQKENKTAHQYSKYNLQKHDIEFQADRYYISPENNTKISFNKDKQLFKLYSKNGENISETCIPFSNVIESTVIIDDQTIAKAERGNQIAGALIGGVVAGGIGAIIGGSSANTVNHKYIKKVVLKIINDDFNCPNYYINFLPFNEKGFLNSDPVCINAIKEVEYWQSVFELAIRKASKVAQ